MPEIPTVRPGQIWADNDKRSSGRYVRVDFLTAGRTHAYVEQVAYNEADRIAAEMPGARKTRIRLDRFRPTSSGYRLVQEAPDA